MTARPASVARAVRQRIGIARTRADTASAIGHAASSAQAQPSEREPDERALGAERSRLRHDLPALDDTMQRRCGR